MSIRKKDGSWQYSIEIGKDPKTGDRKRKSKGGFKTKKECQAALNKIMSDFNKGIFIEVSNMTLEVYLKKYLNSIKPNLTNKTYCTYLYLIDYHLIPNLGAIAAKDLKPLHIQEFYDELHNTNSSTTVRHIHNLLNSALNQAIGWGIIIKNSCDDVRKPKRASVQILVLNEEQIKMLLERIKGLTIFLPTVIAVMTGMREAEVCALKWINIDLDNKILYVKNQLQSIDGTLELVRLKTDNSLRSIPLPDYIVTILKEKQAKQEENKKLLKEKYKDEGFVIDQGDGKPYDPAYISRNFNRVVKEYKDKKGKTLVESLGIPPIHFHCLRHTHATLLLKAGLNAKVVADRLGDTVGTVMKTYAHALPDMQKEVAEKLDNIFLIKVAEMAPN
jgi:integrase